MHLAKSFPCVAPVKYGTLLFILIILIIKTDGYLKLNDNAMHSKTVEYPGTLTYKTSKVGKLFG